MTHIRFDVELPRINAMRLDNTDDLNSFLIGINSGQHIISGERSEDVEISDLRINDDGDQLVQLMFFRHSGNVHHKRIARIGDYIIWNQTKKTFIITARGFDGEWDDADIPEALLLPVARRKVL